MHFWILGEIIMKFLLGLAAVVIFANATAYADDDATPEKERVVRIIGGKQIESMKQWPWLVSIKAKVGNSTYFCGASVVNDEWLLTGAHCFQVTRNPEDWTARMASIKLATPIEDRIAQFYGKVFNRTDWQQYEYGFSEIIIHEKYNRSQTWMNDIALVKVKGRMPVSPDVVPEIQQVQLPTDGDSSFPTEGQRCVMKGWGCKREGGHMSLYARATVLPIVNDMTCSRVFGIDMNTRVCAGYFYRKGGKGICKGDSGGPLVCLKGQDWIQVGVASFTSHEEPGRFYGAFTRVSFYKNWIMKTINSRR